MHVRTLWLASLAASLFSFAHAGEIKIGSVVGVTGPIGETTSQLVRISQGYLDMVNAQGGVNGNKLTMVIKDDGYDPRKTAALTEEAIVKDKVVALVNHAGTPQTIGIVKSRVLNKNKVPLVGVFSGSDLIRGPGSEEIFHTRPTYNDEALSIAKNLSSIGLHRIAVLYQDDLFGQGILQSLTAKEKDFKLDVVVKAAYQPGAKDFTQQAQAIVAAKPQAILLMAVPEAVYQFMKVYGAPTGAAQIYALSFISPQTLADVAGEAKVRGMGISQVVPNPSSATLPVIKDYQDFIHKTFGKTMPLSPPGFECYLNIRLVVEAIKIAGPQPTSEKIMQALASMKNYRVGGFPIDFSGGQRTGSNYLDIAVIGPNAKLLY